MTGASINDIYLVSLWSWKTTFCCVNDIEGDIYFSTTQEHYISSSCTTNSLMCTPIIKMTGEVGVALPRDM